MKKLFVAILLILSACKHETTTEKAKGIVIHYLDSAGIHYMVFNVNHNFKQVNKNVFSCEYIDSEKTTRLPLFCTAYFTLDSNLLKVKKYIWLVH